MGALKNKTTKTQCSELLRYMKKHKKGVSAREAWQELGIERISARIWDLRGMGHEISNTWYTYKNDSGYTVRFVKYVLVKEAV